VTSAGGGPCSSRSRPPRAAAGNVAAVLPTVSVTCYVTPLREGGSLPAIVEADNLGTYVMKFRGTGQGPKALAAEVIGGELARRLGLRTPELALGYLDPRIPGSEPDPEIQDLLRAEPGRRLPAGLGRIRPRRLDRRRRPGEPDPLARRPDPERRPDLAQPEPAGLARRHLADRPRGGAVLPPQLAHGELRRAVRGRRPRAQGGRDRAGRGT